tara:strand:- start:498 stop:1007 length:510 start_codon:yes stop_codon:yes gene_type:complete
MPFPSDVIYRINLAWINTVDELSEILSKHENHKIFLDLPIRRTKPPENRYSIDDLTPIIKNFSNIRYLAVSNVNSKDDVLDIQNKLPDNITLVPKIESILGIVNIKSIIDSIKSKKKIIMLDHDDLYRSIEKNNELISKFQNSINTLIEFCKENEIILLRTRGVIFADD